MQLLATILSAALLFAFTNAENSAAALLKSNVGASTTMAVVSGTAAISPAQSSQAACLDACSANDPSCRASCIISSPGNYAQQNATIECVTKCLEGDGSAADNLAYEDCQKGCLASATVSHASTAETTTAASGEATGGSRSGKGNEVGKTSSGSNGAVVTATSTAPESTTSKSAADNMRSGVSLVGIMGMFAAVITL